MEAGLVAVILLAPMPFGGVLPAGRLALELFSLFLLVLWAVQTIRRPGRCPPRIVGLGLAGLLALGLVQAIPVGEAIASVVSPGRIEIQSDSRPPEDARAAEARILGTDPTTLEAVPALSVTAAHTASALRTGAALVSLLLVACTVAAVCGPRRIALAAVVSAAFQGLYGILVLASGHDMIWNVPKRYYLDCATGTFVNRNHYAGFLEATLALGLGLAVYEARRMREPSRALLIGLATVLGLAGLLLSFSRTGIALGLGALGWTWFLSGGRRVRTSVVVAAAIVLVAAVPLLQIGADRLADRYAAASDELTAEGGRVVVWRDTAAMAARFPITGTGFGTFAEVYPRYRSPEVRLLYQHAHNDALQFLAEGGAIGVGFLLCVLIPVARRGTAGLGGAFGVLGVGAAAGLVALLLHSLVDFNFRIPSNAALAAILGGVVLGLPSWHRRD